MLGDSKQIFISWSGERSRAVAEALNDWVPQVVQTAQCWISTTDIEKGARWGQELAKQLQGTNLGIICVTSDNTMAPWLLFEAGVLSKAIEQSFVCPLLLDIEPADLSGPLAQFQVTRAREEDDFRKLVLTVNRAIGTPVQEHLVSRQFTRMWPELADVLKRIPEAISPLPAYRSEKDVLDEILETVRSLERRAGGNYSPESVTDLKSELLMRLIPETVQLIRDVELSSLQSQVADLKGRLKADEMTARARKFEDFLGPEKPREPSRP